MGAATVADTRVEPAGQGLHRARGTHTVLNFKCISYALASVPAGGKANDPFLAPSFADALKPSNEAISAGALPALLAK